MTPGDLATLLAVLSAIVGGFLGLVFWSVRPDRGRINRSVSERHTAGQVSRRLGVRLGTAQWRLYGMVGDRLDRSSGWTRTPDLIMRVLSENPREVLDFLVEVHGEERVRELLDGEERRRE